jgi:hypothetical protein
VDIVEKECERQMETYWFRRWLKTHLVEGELSLKKALTQSSTLDSLINSAPKPIISVREEPSQLIELTGGKGIDLTGEFGCRHMDCLSKELDGLFRHTWHYFDRILLPDQALVSVLNFRNHKDLTELLQQLLPVVQILKKIEGLGALGLIRFEPRTLELAAPLFKDRISNLIEEKHQSGFGAFPFKNFISRKPIRYRSDYVQELWQTSSDEIQELLFPGQNAAERGVSPTT